MDSIARIEELRKQAYDLIAQGLKVFPTGIPQVKDADGRWVNTTDPKKQKGKEPIYVVNGYEDATDDMTQVNVWLAKSTAARRILRWGVPTGHGNFVFDLDDYKDDTDPKAIELFEQYTPLQETQSGGKHYLFKTDEVIKNGAGKASNLPEGLDIRGLGGYICIYEDIDSRKNYAVPTEELLSLARKAWAQPSNTVTESSSTTRDKVTIVSLDVIRDRLAKINPDLAENEWTNVIKAVYNLTNGDDSALSLLIDWSCGSDKYAGTLEAEANIARDIRYKWDKAAENTYFNGLPYLSRMVTKNPVIVETEHDEPIDFITQASMRFEDAKYFPPPTWLVDQLIPAGEYTALGGAPFEGKSTFLTTMLVQIAKHGNFAGKKVIKGGIRALYLMEEGQSTIGQKAIELEVPEDSGITLVMRRNLPGLSLAQIVENIIRNAAKMPEDKRWNLIVFDTLPRFNQGSGTNDYDDGNIAGALLESLRDSTGAAVIALFHTKKNIDKNTSNTEAFLGTTATAAVADNTIVMRKGTGEQSTTRFLNYEGRTQPEKPIIALIRDDVTKEYRYTTSADIPVDSITSDTRVIWSILPTDKNKAINKKQILTALESKEIEITESTLKTRLQNMVKSNDIYSIATNGIATLYYRPVKEQSVTVNEPIEDKDIEEVL